MLWTVKLQILLGLIPGLVWLFFFLQEDPDGEPPKLIAATFVIGAAFAFFALLVQLALNERLVQYNLSTTAPIAIIAMALIEEVAKFMAAFTSVHRNRAFDVPTDAMIYMIVAALGFATVENLGAVATRPSLITSASGMFETATFRFAGATLLHALAAGIIGYHWARGLMKGRLVIRIVWGIVLATALHALFNYLILGHGTLFYALVFVLFGGLFVLKDFEELNRARINVRG